VELEPKSAPLKTGAVRFCDPRIPQGTLGTQTRHMLFPSLIGVDMSSKKLIPNYLGRLEEHIDTIRHFQQLDQHLLPLHQELADANEYKRFPAAFALPLISPIGGAIMGVKSWDDVDVVNESQKLLGRDRDVAWEVIENWRKRALLIVHEEFDRLRELEKAIYSSKAFSSDKAIEIINISSDEELETDTSESEPEPEPPKKPKGKKMKDEGKQQHSGDLSAAETPSEQKSKGKKVKDKGNKRQHSGDSSAAETPRKKKHSGDLSAAETPSEQKSTGKKVKDKDNKRQHSGDSPAAQTPSKKQRQK